MGLVQDQYKLVHYQRIFSGLKNVFPCCIRSGQFNQQNLSLWDMWSNQALLMLSPWSVLSSFPTGIMSSYGFTYVLPTISFPPIPSAWSSSSRRLVHSVCRMLYTLFYQCDLMLFWGLGHKMASPFMGNCSLASSLLTGSHLKVKNDHKFLIFSSNHLILLCDLYLKHVMKEKMTLWENH